MRLLGAKIKDRPKRDRIVVDKTNKVDETPRLSDVLNSLGAGNMNIDLENLPKWNKST